MWPNYRLFLEQVQQGLIDLDEAADTLEDQAKEIEVLKIAHEAHQTSNLKMLAVLKQQAFDLEKRKAL